MHQLYRSVPLVWRSGRCAQLGVDDPVLIDGLTAADAELLDLVRRGVSDADLIDAARASGVGEARARSLLELLREAGALRPESGAEIADVRLEAYAARTAQSAEEATGTISGLRVLACGPLADELSRTLGSAGLAAEAVSAEDACAQPAEWTAITSLWTHSIGASAELHRADRSHVSVRIGDGGADVVPVVPGATPCLTCAVLDGEDDEDGWQRGWIGLREASASAIVDPLLSRAAVVAAASLIRDAAVRCGESGRRLMRLRVDADGFGVECAPLVASGACDCLAPLTAPPVDGGAESITAGFAAAR